MSFKCLDMTPYNVLVDYVASCYNLMELACMFWRIIHGEAIGIYLL